MIDSTELVEARRRTAAAAAPEPPPGLLGPIGPKPAAVEAAPIGTAVPVSNEPPASSQFALTIARRAALRGAVRRLKTRASGPEHVLAAVEAADEDGTLTALVALAVSEWLDANCGRPDTSLTEWSAKAEYALRDAVFADPAAVPADAEPYLRELADSASVFSGAMHDQSGRPARNRPGPVSLLRILVPR